MSSADNVKRLERRINALKNAINDLRSEQEELREDIEDLQAFRDRVQDQFEDVHDTLDGHGERLREVRVHRDRLDEHDARLGSKVGQTRAEAIEEQIRQLRTRLDFLADAVDDAELERDI